MFLSVSAVHCGDAEVLPGEVGVVALDKMV